MGADEYDRHDEDLKMLREKLKNTTAESLGMAEEEFEKLKHAGHNLGQQTGE